METTSEFIKNSSSNNNNNNNNNNNKLLENDEYVFYNEGGKVMSGGFSVESILLKNNGSLMSTKNDNQLYSGLGGGVGGKVSDIFKNLAIPFGIYLGPKQYGGGKSNNNNNNDNIDNNDDVKPLSDDIHDKLLDLVKVDSKSKARKTRRNIGNTNTITKKQKNKK